MDKLRQVISNKFSGHRGPLYVVSGLLIIVLLILAAISVVDTTISLIDSIFNSKYDMDYMVAAGIVVSALLCMAFENVFTIPVVKEDPKFRRGFARTWHIVELVVVSAGIRVLYALVINPSIPLTQGELSVWPLTVFGIENPWLYVIANIALHTMTVVATYFLAYCLCGRWNSALAAGFVIAIWPGSLFVTTVAGTEAEICTFLFVTAMLCGTIAVNRSGKMSLPIAIVAIVAMAVFSSVLTVISFIGMIPPVALIISLMAKPLKNYSRVDSKIRWTMAIGGFLLSVGMAYGLAFLLAHVTGEVTLFSQIFTAGASLPEDVMARFSSVWGGEITMVDSMMSNSIKPTDGTFASVYDSLSGSPLILKAICQLYFTGMLYVAGRGIVISFRNGQFDARPSVGIFMAAILAVVLTVIAPDTQIYHMPIIAIVVCLASLGFGPVEPDYEGL